jgi:hypothetical protein
MSLEAMRVISHFHSVLSYGVIQYLVNMDLGLKKEALQLLLILE